ncbi:MAG TPA: aldo/keto reductase [Cyclobacteriaceae bacterium]|nr:aldo/keto reductase [Cyclobacteriaceae bacterium]
MNRKESIILLTSLGLTPFSGWSFMESTISKRKIPKTQEELPCVGIGTWQTFDVGNSEAERGPLKDVLQKLIEGNATVIDSSPMYGSSEQVVGDLSQELKINNKLLIATKVWTSGEAAGIKQMNNSFSLLKRDRMDLMQIHNLVDWQTHLKTLRKWKEQGKVRYIGLTHYTDSAHDTFASIIKNNPVDFIQINYNLLDRHAEEKLLPLAQELKVAVLINRPFEEGDLFGKVKGKALPEWATEFDCTSWAQLFLKFILANPAVTCVIPGTSKVTHLLDNLKAGTGKLPDSNHKKKMIDLIR